MQLVNSDEFQILEKPAKGQPESTLQTKQAFLTDIRQISSCGRMEACIISKFVKMMDAFSRMPGVLSVIEYLGEYTIHLRAALEAYLHRRWQL